MQRRNFIKDTLLVSTGWLIWPQVAGAIDKAPQDAFDSLFKTPPDAAKPWVFWQWMNGHITKAGITADLEAMKHMGIGGAICFNNAVGIPRGPVDYASEEWMQATEHAANEAKRLGLLLTIHNSPGYSGCGGPWITPDKSMQQLVWTEARTNSTGNVSIQLSQPYAKHQYYQDAFVIAYPSLPVETMLMKEALQKVSVNGIEIDKNILTDGSPETRIRLALDHKKAEHLVERTISH